MSSIASSKLGFYPPQLDQHHYARVEELKLVKEKVAMGGSYPVIPKYTT